jgi:hypothetical protein
MGDPTAPVPANTVRSQDILTRCPKTFFCWVSLFALMECASPLGAEPDLHSQKVSVS